MVDGSRAARNSLAGQRVSKVVPALSVVAELQQSSKWPNDISTLRYIKSALVISLSEIIKKQFKVLFLVSNN